MQFILRKPMKKYRYLYLLASLSCMSCTSFKNIASHNRSFPSQDNQKKELIFLDELNVVPGNNRTILTEPPIEEITSKKNSGIPTVTYDISNFNVIQLKFGLLLDIPFEQLNNLKFLKSIEYWMGTKYCLGGTTENCIDCSAFTQTIEKDVFSKEIPRTAAQQYKAINKITREELKPGDLVFFNTARNRVSHVGVYIANNKFVHASVSNGVMISDLDENYWKQRFVGCGRAE